MWWQELGANRTLYVPFNNKQNDNLICADSTPTEHLFFETIILGIKKQKLEFENSNDYIRFI